MNLIELFQKTGLGIMATASKDGSVNTAVYARPHVRPRYLREDLQRLDNLGGVPRRGLWVPTGR
jgi:hypothetical protein